MHKILRASLGIFVGATLLVVFQNCGSNRTSAPVDAQSEEAAAASAVKIPEAEVRAAIEKAADTCVAIMNNMTIEIRQITKSPVQVKTPGPRRYAGSVVGTVTGTGSFNLMGYVGGATVNEIIDFQGDANLCDSDLKFVTRMNGNLVVSNGQLDVVDGIVGNVVVIGGPVPRIKSMTGDLFVLTESGEYVGRRY